MKYLRLFETDEDYEDFASTRFPRPNVTHIKQSLSKKQRYNKDLYLTFTALESNSSVSLNRVGTTESFSCSFEYSIDKGIHWQAYTIGTSVSLSNIGDNIKFRGTNNRLGLNESNPDYHKFVMTGKIAGSGDVTSLLNNYGGNQTLSYNYALQFLFYNCTSLVIAPNLPSTTTSVRCYYRMFEGCTNLLKGPDLPANTIRQNSYTQMFFGCNKLKQIPNISAQYLTASCANMFGGCTNVEYAPYFDFTEFDLNSNNGMSSMFNNCQKIKHWHFKTIHGDSNIFGSNSSCLTFTIDATTPPNLKSDSITGLKSTCIIYVPDDSVDLYKAANYWSARANYIKPMSERPNDLPC